MSRQFLVTGCARSGTTYTAEVLRILGVQVSQEKIFNPKDNPHFNWSGCEVAWEAVPYIARIKCPILLQVRHPLSAISSMVAIGLFSRKHEHTNYILKYMPWIKAETQLESCARYWLFWNYAAGLFATRTYRVEALQPADFEDVLGFIPRLPNISDEINTARLKYRVEGVRWNNLPPVLASVMREQARKFGYEDS